MLFYSRGYLLARGLFRGETFVLTLFALLGMMVMISANHFLTLYLGLELQALSLYAMVAMHRTSNAASEAAMKYFVLGALASGMLLYGMSMIYGATGSLDSTPCPQAIFSGGGNRRAAAFGLVFVVSGIAFKLGVVPYHMWVPDVYHGAPTPVTLLIGTAPKLAAFAFMLRLLAVALAGLEFDWQGMLMVLSLLSMILGNVIAIAQTNIKRMLAYSTIANMGFMLLGFLAANLNGYSAAMFYAVAYVLTSLASFGVVMLLSREGFEADRLDDFKGLNQRSPWWAFIMLLVMFSLAGMPPTVGFYAKFSVHRGGGRGRLRLARRRRGDGVAGRRVLLPAHRQADVLRRPDRHCADRAARRQPRAAVGERARAAAVRHPAAAADGAVRRRARVVRLPLIARPGPTRGGGTAGGRARGAPADRFGRRRATACYHFRVLRRSPCASAFSSPASST